MGYLTADGFDEYTTLSQFWDFVAVTGTVVMSSSYARYPTLGSGIPSQGLRMAPGVGVGAQAVKLFEYGATAATLTVGMWISLPALPSAGDVAQLCSVGAPPTYNPYFLVGLFVDSTGALYFVNTLGQIGRKTPAGLVIAGQWLFIEMAVTINSGAGTAALYVNGSLMLNGTALNTNTGYPTVPNLAYNVQVVGAEAEAWYDDLYALSGLTPLGPGRVITKKPTGVGDLTNWTPTGQPANWECVNEVPPDDDTTYVSAASSIYDSYAMPLAGLSGLSNLPPAFVVTRSRARYDDGGPHTFQGGVRSSGVNGVGGAVPLTGSYVTFTTDYLIDDPATSAPWTATGADNAQLLKYRPS